MVKIKTPHILYTINFNNIFTLEEFIQNYKRIKAQLPNQYQLKEFTEEQYNRLGTYMDKVEKEMYFTGDVVMGYANKDERSQIQREINKISEDFDHYRTLFRLIRTHRYNFSQLGLWWFKLKTKVLAWFNQLTRQYEYWEY